MAKSMQDTPRMKIVPGPKTGAANANAGSPRGAELRECSAQGADLGGTRRTRAQTYRETASGRTAAVAPDVPSTNSTQAPSSEPERK